jgi:hypothetical protein
MAVEYVGDGRPDGVCVGQSGEKVGFFGTAPATQQATISATTTDTLGAVATNVKDLVTKLKTLGIIASS